MSVEFLEPNPRFSPRKQMEIVEYHLDDLRKALAGGRFAPAVREAQLLADVIRFAAIAEDSAAAAPSREADSVSEGAP